MTSPNEPGQSGLGERPAAADGTADLPPWQTAARGRTDGIAQQAATEAYARAGVAQGVSLPVSRYLTGSAAPDLSGLDSRNPLKPAPAPTHSMPLSQGPMSQGPMSQGPLSQGSMSQGPTPPAAANERTDVVSAAAIEAYPSELPDLSGPMPKPTLQRRSPAEPAPAPSSSSSAMTTATSRIQVANRPRGPVRASMQIRRIDPWSALKVSALLSGALFFIWMIAVAFLYLVLGAMGVWAKLNSNVGDLLTSGSGAGGDLVSAGSIFGGAALVGLVNIVLLTAMATIGAYIYNLSTDIVGGVEVTLADLD